MHITITIPESLPKERVRQRVKELEESLLEDAKFFAAVESFLQTESGRYLPSQTSWLGCMADTGEIIGDIVSPTHGELVVWEVLGQ